MVFFNKENIYTGYSMEQLAKIRGILDEKGIKYRYKIMNRSNQWIGRGTSRGNFGSVGMNSDFENQYIIFVRKKDAEAAKYWINRINHP